MLSLLIDVKYKPQREQHSCVGLCAHTLGEDGCLLSISQPITATMHQIMVLHHSHTAENDVTYLYTGWSK